MGLPLILAMTAAEISAAQTFPENLAWMACQFSSCGQGLTNLPTFLPPGAVLILNDRFPCQGHSPDLVAQQLRRVIGELGCESVLLDFQRPPEPESEAMARTLLQALPCPVVISESYGAALDCPILLPPGPLHLPPERYLAPWKDREIWLEAALCQEHAAVTERGTSFASRFPTDHLEGGFYDDTLCCHYRTELRDGEIRFTLFDTRDSLVKKLEKSHALGVTRAVGLYQELS